MKAEYACIFGISSPIDGLKAGEQVNAFYDGLTIITIHGKGGRIFWFMIKKMEKKFTYPDRPRFPPEDVERVVATIGQYRIWGNIYVKDLWDRKEVMSMTPLEENVFETWHYDRMVLLGDSVHKVCNISFYTCIVAKINKTDDSKLRPRCKLRNRRCCITCITARECPS